VALQLTAAAFQEGGAIPRKFTCEGLDVSPALSWQDPPAATQSFALVMVDPDAPGDTWVHWVIYNLPADARGLPEGVGKERDRADGSRQAGNNFGKIGYNGPCPPRGPAHRYFFKLYALDAKLDPRAATSRAELERAMKDHILEHAQLMGTFRR
jgi:Raf kinase inhibitor-like YbhB/YbcL family protein